jgi:ankyrin repeat protein
VHDVFDVNKFYSSSYHLQLTSCDCSAQPDKSGRTALHWAAISGHTDIVKFLLEKGANIQAETSNKMNALHGAVEGGRVETVRALMEFVQGKDELKTALIIAKNGDEKTASELSAALKNRAICRILKDMGNSNGSSASCTIA